jgi:arylsulfatase A-like enzyme
LLTLVYLALTLLAQPLPAAETPNFIIVLTDDQGYGDLGCYGSPDIRTPNIDRMAAEGLRLTDFYTAAPACTPSRAALLTGCYPKRIGLAGTVITPGSTSGLSPDEITLAELLKSAGYATALIGKWHLGHTPGMMPLQQGFDVFYGVPYSNDMDYGVFRGNSGLPLILQDDVVEQPADVATLTQRYTEQAVSFIEEHRDRPFFLYVAHTMPHVPLVSSAPFLGRSGAGIYGDVIEEIDWSTGRIINTLRRLGIDGQTIVVFTSDNGPHRSQEQDRRPALLRGGKGGTYEGGMRVPCVVWAPGRVPGGRVSGELVTAMDLFPTFAGLAGAKIPPGRDIDGRDIWPVLCGQPGCKPPHDAFYYFGRQGDVEAVRRGNWKLRMVQEVLSRAGGDETRSQDGVAPDGDRKIHTRIELYDLGSDVSESKNLAKQHPEIVDSLAVRMVAFDNELRRTARPAGGRRKPQK